MARKSSSPVVVASESETRGPSAETLAFARKVVDLRDKKGLPWKSVASALGVPYDHNGSSRLRRAYTLGNGATVGVRAASATPVETPAPKRSAKRAPKGTSAKSAPAPTPAERRAARQAGAAKVAKPAPKRTRRAAA
jgi:hypothetical protein